MTKEELLHYANTIQISLDEERATLILSQINDILAYISVLESSELGSDCSLSGEFQFMLDDANRFREDIPRASLPLAEALQNAPNKNENFFKVPKFME